MKELDGLRKALVERTPGEWRGDRYDGTVKYGIRGPLGGYILCHDPETGLLAIEEPDARAIVLSVNLAPHLLRVAGAAEEVVELSLVALDPTQTGELRAILRNNAVLRMAAHLNALKEAAREGER